MKWHQALAYAVTGERFPQLGEQDQPDLDALADWLAGRVREVVVPLPSDLIAGLGPAQFHAALAELRRRLQPPPAAPVLASRPLTTEERRLLADVPPHHL